MDVKVWIIHKSGSYLKFLNRKKELRIIYFIQRYFITAMPCCNTVLNIRHTYITNTRVCQKDSQTYWMLKSYRTDNHDATNPNILKSLIDIVTNGQLQFTHIAMATVTLGDHDHKEPQNIMGTFHKHLKVMSYYLDWSYFKIILPPDGDTVQGLSSLLC